MKIKLDKVNNILSGTSILLAIIFNIYIYLMVESKRVFFITLIFSLLIISIFFVYKIIYKKHMENIFIQLSDMLGTIIDMKDEEIFSTIEDTLFSKLQYQTIKLTNILKEKNNQIEIEKNEIKSLISDIAHQLKTPLTNLKIYGELLNDESLNSEEKKEFTDIMTLSLDRLAFLVESMIKMSRLESGVINLRAEINDLNDTVILAISQVQKKAREKNINIELIQKDKIKILHDKNWITEAILNILENGVKYTQVNGVIKITIQSYEMFVRIDIEDNGIGIKEEEIPKIFMRFYRGNNVGDTEGIGIGLYLTRIIISKHGGYIQVTSDKRGTKFSIFLPNNYFNNK